MLRKVIGIKCPNIELGKHRKRPQEGVWNPGMYTIKIIKTKGVKKN